MQPPLVLVSHDSASTLEPLGLVCSNRRDGVRAGASSRAVATIASITPRYIRRASHVSSAVRNERKGAVG